MIRIFLIFKHDMIVINSFVTNSQCQYKSLVYQKNKEKMSYLLTIINCHNKFTMIDNKYQ